MDDKACLVDRDFGKAVRTATQCHIELKSTYVPDDVRHLSYETDIGDPGAYPFTRGLYPEMYRNRLWLKSFIVSYSSPEETNQAIKEYIANGMTDIRMNSDLPTQCGIDPDHPAAWNSMMCGGVASYALYTYEKMLAGLPLENVVYELAHMGISNFIYIYGLFVAMMENKGLNLHNLHGNCINDPIRAKLVYECPDLPTPIARRVWLDHIEYAIRHTPRWKPCVPNGVDPQQRGMDVARELGGCIAVAITMIEDLRQRGITIDDYGPMVFSMDAESDFFETICKFRAARKLWARIAKERLGAKTKRAMQLKIGIRTSGLSLTWQKPLNNAARVALQIMSCVLGGVNSLDASSIDEAFGLPSLDARVFNLDTQHIVTHETNVPLVADPLGGSYYVEWLTGKIEQETEKYIAELDDRGGIFSCLDSGYLHSVMEANRLRIQKEKEECNRLIVGVNAFRSAGEEGHINKAIQHGFYKVPTVKQREEMVAEVKQYKARRDMGAVKKGVRELYRATKAGENVTRPIIEAAKVGVTIGEVVGTIRAAYDIAYDPFGLVKAPGFVNEAIKE
ncbi:MAG: methylmalonyl-CoA mutase family protein [bacterium]